MVGDSAADIAAARAAGIRSIAVSGGYSLVEAAEFIRVLQRRQGQLIAAPEEVAFHNGWISADQLRAQAAKFSKSQYGVRLLDNLRR